MFERYDFKVGTPKKAILREYKYNPANAGDRAEAVFGLNWCGELKAKNPAPYWAEGDIDDIQVKSNRGHGAEGWDIDEYITRSAARRYAYVFKDETKAVIMNPADWKVFVTKWGEKTFDSKGNPIIRLKAESAEMEIWLDIKVNGIMSIYRWSHAYLMRG